MLACSPARLPAVARTVSDNRKAYSARLSCIVKEGVTQGVYLVQVRTAADGDSGGARVEEGTTRKR